METCQIKYFSQYTHSDGLKKSHAPKIDQKEQKTSK